MTRTRNKRSNKLDKPLPEIAQSFADRFIASYGIKDAEQIAKLAYEKVVASRKGLERKYGTLSQSQVSVHKMCPKKFKWRNEKRK